MGAFPVVGVVDRARCDAWLLDIGRGADHRLVAHDAGAGRFLVVHQTGVSRVVMVDRLVASNIFAFWLHRYCLAERDRLSPQSSALAVASAVQCRRR